MQTGSVSTCPSCFSKCYLKPAEFCIFFALLSNSFKIINNTQPISPVGVVLVNFLAGIIKNRSPISKATVESVAKPGYLKKDKCVH